jgi:DNA uptake protein ComE-like DNA-binding protein
MSTTPAIENRHEPHSPSAVPAGANAAPPAPADPEDLAAEASPLSPAEQAQRRLEATIAWRYAAPAFILLPLVLGLYLFSDRMPVPAADQAGAHARLLSGQLNPNTATWAELAMLPRIGETLARRIVAYREEQLRAQPAGSAEPGPVFRCLEDLDAVPGIGPRTLEAIGPYLTFE